MAEYQLTKQEYDRLGARRRRSRPLHLRLARSARRLAFAGAVLLLLAIPVYFGQWLFSVACAVFLASPFWCPSRMDLRDFENDCFKSGLVHVEVAPTFLTVRSGETSLRLAYSDLEGLYELDDSFALSHPCGLDIRIPRSPLSESDISILQGLQEELPSIAKKLSS